MSLLFHPDLLHVEVAGDVTVIRFTTAWFEDGNAEAIGQQLADLVDRLGRHRLHLDLAKVQLVSSLGLAQLVALNRKVRAVGGEFRVYNVRPEVYQVFAATHLTRLLDILPQEPGQDTVPGASG
jgi:anti-anti-sigma factor